MTPEALLRLDASVGHCSIDTSVGHCSALGNWMELERVRADRSVLAATHLALAPVGEVEEIQEGLVVLVVPSAGQSQWGAALSRTEEQSLLLATCGPAL